MKSIAAKGISSARLPGLHTSELPELRSAQRARTGSPVPSESAGEQGRRPGRAPDIRGLFSPWQEIEEVEIAVRYAGGKKQRIVVQHPYGVELAVNQNVDDERWGYASSDPFGPAVFSYTTDLSVTLLGVRRCVAEGFGD